MSRASASARSRLDLSETNALEEAKAQDRALTPPTLKRSGSSAAGGTRRNGSSAAFRPLPISIPSSATGRSGSSAPTATPSWANSAAMKAAGVTARDLDPAGGRIEETRSGNPTGRVRRCGARSWSRRPCRSRCPRNAIARWPRRRRSCSRTASPRPATWAPTIDDWLIDRGGWANAARCACGS